MELKKKLLIPSLILGTSAIAIVPSFTSAINNSNIQLTNSDLNVDLLSNNTNTLPNTVLSDSRALNDFNDLYAGPLAFLNTSEFRNQIKSQLTNSSNSNVYKYQKYNDDKTITVSTININKYENVIKLASKDGYTTPERLATKNTTGTALTDEQIKQVIYSYMYKQPININNSLVVYNNDSSTYSMNTNYDLQLVENQSSASYLITKFKITNANSSDFSYSFTYGDLIDMYEPYKTNEQYKEQYYKFADEISSALNNTTTTKETINSINDYSKNPFGVFLNSSAKTTIKKELLSQNNWYSYKDIVDNGDGTQNVTHTYKLDLEKEITLNYANHYSFPITLQIDKVNLNADQINQFVNEYIYNLPINKYANIVSKENNLYVLNNGELVINAYQYNKSITNVNVAIKTDTNKPLTIKFKINDLIDMYEPYKTNEQYKEQYYKSADEISSALTKNNKTETTKTEETIKQEENKTAIIVGVVTSVIAVVIISIITWLVIRQRKKQKVIK